VATRNQRRASAARQSAVRTASTPEPVETPSVETAPEPVVEAPVAETTEKPAVERAPVIEVTSTGAKRTLNEDGTPMRKRSTRASVESLTEAALAMARKHADKQISWVDALRTARWEYGVGCDYKKWRPIWEAAVKTAADEREAAAKPAPAKRTASKSA